MSKTIVEQELLEYIPQKERDSYDADDFAGPDRSFPITTQAQLDAAAHLIGHAANPDAVKAKAIAIAKRKGFTLPDAWKKDDSKSEEAAMERPKAKIATITVCYLEDNARSLNGRIYPKVTCDQIQANAEKKLLDPHALPMTCFVSHETANSNGNVALAGRVVKVWNIGPKRMANIDIADTSIAHDMLALIEGGYMRSESMRVQGIKLVYSDQYDLPLVVAEDGYEPELMGIDLTTRPGLIDTARIMEVLYESVEHKPYIEAFPLTDVQIETQKGDPDMRIPYFVQVALGTVQEAMTEDRKAHQKVHDHLAGVMDTTIKECHGGESARLMALVEAELSEEGRAIAKVHATKIAAAHDVAAHQLGMDCEGCYSEALGLTNATDDDTDEPDPGDDDGKKQQESSIAHSPTPKGGIEDMTPQEMMEALKAQGFQVAPPKTADELLEERIAAAVEARLKTLTESQQTTPPQRQTLAANTLSETSGLPREQIYEDGDFLKGDLKPQNWKSLADRRVPWPKDIDPGQALYELAPFLTHRLLEQEAAAQGRSLDQFIKPYEVI